MSLTITQSSAAVYNLCPRKYQYRYDDCLVQLRRDPALEFGTMIHAALDVYHQAVNGMSSAAAAGEAVAAMVNDCGDDALRLAVASEMMIGYGSRWARDPLPATETEVEFAFELAPGVVFRGKIDGIVGDGKVLIEHKTASSVGAAYIDRLAIDAQVHLYAAALRSTGVPVRAVVYNVLCKPSIRRRTGEPVPAYRARLAEWYSRPDRYVRIELPIQEWVLDAAMDDLRATAAAITGGDRRKSTGACGTWGRSCDYLGLCTARYNDIAIKAGYTHKDPHSELATK